MNDEDPQDESIEARLREIARRASRSMERAMGEVDLDEIANRIDAESERLKEMVELAARWLAERGVTGSGQSSERQPPPAHEAHAPSGGEGPRSGPHPLDVPSEAQGRALSGLGSGRWTVQAGSHVLIDESGEAVGADGVVGELRARDWITAAGELTLVGQDALRRWMATAQS